MKPTYEQLQTENAQLHKDCQAQLAVVAKQGARIAELESLLGNIHLYQTSMTITRNDLHEKMGELMVEIERTMKREPVLGEGK